MKRLWILLLTLCVSALFCVSTLGLGAEEAKTDIWNVYSLKEDMNGLPHFDIPPNYEYTSEGLRVSPREGMESYTVQSDMAFSLEDGLYMEVKLDSSPKLGVMVFHLWDQSGMMLSNFHCGSGWEGLLQLDPNTSQLVLSAFVRDAKVAQDGGTLSILGTMKVNSPIAEDGSVTYSLTVKDNALYINGTPVVGTEEAIRNLKEIRPDGTFYVGVTVNMTGQDDGIPLTVTRFGLSSDSATVPGMSGELPETGPAVVETTAPPSNESEAPTGTKEDTKTPTGDETKPTEPETGPSGSQDTTAAGSGQATEPTTEEGTTYDPYGDPPDMTTESYNSPFRETEPTTRREIKDDAVDNFMAKIEANCASSLGVGSLGIVSVMAAAYVCIRRKEREENTPS